MKKVTLIGASGYVGSAILNELLNRNHQVTAVVRNPEKIVIQNANLEVVKADISNVNEIVSLSKGKDAVISAYNPGWANPRIYEETLENYPKIIEVAKQSGVKRLLIVGGSCDFICRARCEIDRYS
uniref:NAD(P)-dependent oxidoreductase n=1 Tax=Ornithobacterium rhinotracheale TaxID=28251 RepID=UPI0021AA5414|nr:NAD(P)H-binding protein [Ornithobacterium rhinotracheale]